jgi:hypothetical protein
VKKIIGMRNGHYTFFRLHRCQERSNHSHIRACPGRSWLRLSRGACG